jgi:hypothetical protein
VPQFLPLLHGQRDRVTALHEAADRAGERIDVFLLFDDEQELHAAL